RYHFQPVRQLGPHPQPARPEPARRELSSRALARAGPEPLGGPEGSAVPRARRPRGRTFRGAHAPLPTEPARPRTAGAGALSRAAPRSRVRLARAGDAPQETAAPDGQAAVKRAAKTSLVETAWAVGDALHRGGIRGVLTGGACASLYTRGE